MLVSIHQTTRCHILEDRGLNAYLPKYLKIEVDGRILLKWILQEWYSGKDWIYIAQDKNR